jgi:hypothetical protein
MSKKESQPTRVLDLKQGEYSDGSPLDEVQYLECKLILKPDPLHRRKGVLRVWEVGGPNGERTWYRVQGRRDSAQTRDPGSVVLGYRRFSALQPGVIWRERGSHHALCGEFAFQAKFKRRDELHDKAVDRCKQFFIALQQSGRNWLSLGTTKTGLVYRLKGNPPQSHE